DLNVGLDEVAELVEERQDLRDDLAEGDVARPAAAEHRRQHLDELVERHLAAEAPAVALAGLRERRVVALDVMVAELQVEARREAEEVVVEVADLHALEDRLTDELREVEVDEGTAERGAREPELDRVGLVRHRREIEGAL